MLDLPPFKPTTEFKLTIHPNPEYTYGQSVESTEEGKKWMEGLKGGWTTVDTSKEDPTKLYHLCHSGIAPRPVAFVSSISKNGIENIAPFSWFNMVSSKPPVIAIGCGSKPDGLKDTAQNILASKEFTVNIISEPWVDQANMACIDAPPNVSEWDISGLTKEPSVHVKAPRVRESAFSMECELFQAVPIVDPATNIQGSTLILGHIKFIHVRNDVIQPGRLSVDPGKMKAISRLGGVTYGVTSSGFDLKRKTWKEFGEEIKEALGDDIEKPVSNGNSSAHM